MESLPSSALGKKNGEEGPVLSGREHRREARTGFPDAYSDKERGLEPSSPSPVDVPAPPSQSVSVPVDVPAPPFWGTRATMSRDELPQSV